MITGRIMNKYIIIILLSISFLYGSLSFASEIKFVYSVIDSHAIGISKIGDINQDCFNDLVAVIHEDQNNFIVCYEYPSWKKHVLTVISNFEDFSSYRSCDMELGDIDGDGDLDIAGRIGLPHPNDNDGVNCWFENPAPQSDPFKVLWKRHDLGATHYAKDVELVDLDNNGKLDIVTRSSAHKLHIHLQQKHSDSWKDIVLKIPGFDGLSTGDIDNDGDPDLVLNGFWIATPEQATQPWKKYDFDCKWYTQHTGDPGRWFDNNTKVLVYDMNRDGRLDIIIAMAETKGFPVCWYESPNNPTSDKWIQHIIGYMDCCHSLNVADFDMDGDPDVMAAELGITEAPFPVVVFVNDGDALKWTRQTLSNLGNYSATVGDIDNDGDPDIVGLRKYNAPPIEMWQNLSANDAAVKTEKEHEERQFYLPITVKTGEIRRFDKAVSVNIDFADIYKSVNIKEKVDLGSLKLIKVDTLGNMLNDDVVFQFDSDPKLSNSGTLVFIMSGYTPAYSECYYRLYFDSDSHNFERSCFSEKIQIETSLDYQGEDAYKISTPQATYYYHQFGSGFASLIDVNGNDWISYRPEGGAAGHYRGIPNLAYDGLGEFHPGRGEGNKKSRLVYQGPARVRIQSESKDEEWGCYWDFYPAYATMTLFKKGENPYWILYEGTPGGRIDVDGDFWMDSSGEKRPVSQDWVGELSDPEWVCFGDKGLGRVLFFAHHEDDEASDQFWQMQQNMTVFGFGREYKCCAKYLTRVPAHLTIGFAENNDFEEIKAVVASAIQPVHVQVGDMIQADE